MPREVLEQISNIQQVAQKRYSGVNERQEWKIFFLHQEQPKTWNQDRFQHTWGIGVFGQNVDETQGQVMELKAEKACDLVRMKAGGKKNA